ncbi:MAG TPA: hypothetical protein DHV22_02870 [Xanthomarina gelatinilytica]|uniref:GIY-YIG domain-containing protein n=1 Tax=Xanthomarina gelatinilytica TaxID=1137281 RepID=A0A3D6BPM9_9FLAO|nr:hypothetical protein [Xanthomarina gelatinilytica]
MKMQTFDFSLSQETRTIEAQSTFGPGCYVLYQNKAIARLGAIDAKGILYIGKGDNIFHRVNSLKRSVLDNCRNNPQPLLRGHQTLSKKIFRIQKFIAVELLRINILIPNNMDDARHLESYLLESYVSKYGELPPLNGQYGSFSLADSIRYLEFSGIDIREIDFI